MNRPMTESDKEGRQESTKGRTAIPSNEERETRRSACETAEKAPQKTMPLRNMRWCVINFSFALCMLRTPPGNATENMTPRTLRKIEKKREQGTRGEKE